MDSTNREGPVSPAGPASAGEREMRSLLELSSEVAQTLDPLQVADRTAAHVARALQADLVTISLWERERDIVRMLGEFLRDPSRAPDYPLVRYPDTRAKRAEAMPEPTARSWDSAPPTGYTGPPLRGRAAGDAEEAGHAQASRLVPPVASPGPA